MRQVWKPQPQRPPRCGDRISGLSQARATDVCGACAPGGMGVIPAHARTPAGADSASLPAGGQGGVEGCSLQGCGVGRTLATAGMPRAEAGPWARPRAARGAPRSRRAVPKGGQRPRRVARCHLCPGRCTEDPEHKHKPSRGGTRAFPSFLLNFVPRGTYFQNMNNNRAGAGGPQQAAPGPWPAARGRSWSPCTSGADHGSPHAPRTPAPELRDGWALLKAPWRCRPRGHGQGLQVGPAPQSHVRTWEHWSDHTLTQWDQGPVVLTPVPTLEHCEARPAAAGGTTSRSMRRTPRFVPSPGLHPAAPRGLLTPPGGPRPACFLHTVEPCRRGCPSAGGTLPREVPPAKVPLAQALEQGGHHPCMPSSQSCLSPQLP